MKKQKNIKFMLTACVITSFILTGCGDDDNSSTAVATAPPAADALEGTTVSFNPEIEFLADGFNYSNSTAGSDLPAGVVSGTIVIEEGSDTITITMTSPDQSFDSKDLILTMSDFYDDENDGVINRFTCAFEWGDVTGSEEARFVGVGPANPDYEGEVQDFTGAPTEAEWNKYIVGRYILDTEDGYDPESGGQVVSSTTVEESYSEPGYEEETVTTYTYKKTGETTAEISYTSVETGYYTEDNEKFTAVLKERGDITLTFDTFYKARYSDVWEETEYTLNGQVDPNFGTESGTDTGLVEFLPQPISL